MSRQKEIPVDELPKLGALGEQLLEALKQVFPERIGTTDQAGVSKGWCFEKAHAIRHIVRNIMLYGALEGTSAQGAEHAHKYLVKNPALLSNRKQMLLCLIKYHSRLMKARALNKPGSAMASSRTERGDSQDDSLDVQVQIEHGDDDMEVEISQLQVENKNSFLPCELGIRYPCILAAKERDKLHIRAKVCIIIDFKTS